MTGPRPVRIARARAPAASTGADPSATATEVRPNGAGTRRAARIAIVYSVSVLALTAILAGLDLSGPNAGRPGEIQGLELFLGIAAAIAVAAFLYPLTPAPRRLEVTAAAVVVVGRWGRRRQFGALGTFPTQLVRHFPRGPLAPDPVDAVRVIDARGRPVVYEVDAGWFDVRAPAG